MKKNDDVGLFYWKSRIKKMLLLMKLMCFWILVGLMQVHATTYGQAENVSFEQKKLTIDQVFNTITVQLKYDIFYSDDAIDVKRVVELSELDLTVEETLRQALGDKYEYKFVGKTIVISPKTVVPQAKSLRVKGFVRDVNKHPMPGVTVRVIGMPIGTATDTKGRFSMELPVIEGKLEFSFVGFQNQTVSFSEKTAKDTLYITLQEDIQTIDEVVVTGYGDIARGNYTGAATTVKASDIMMAGVSSIDQMLQGVVPGMLVWNTTGQVGATAKIRVRGTSTLLGSQEPVWVVDGVIQRDPQPFNSEDNTKFSVDADDIKQLAGNAISWLNPNDIETITVLKDASATAIYGSKAANGVIVVTTKKASIGKITVNYSGDFSIGQRPRYGLYDLMNSAERMQLSKEMYEERRTFPTGSMILPIGYEGLVQRLMNKEITLNEMDKEYKRMARQNTDWFDILFRNSFNHSHSLGISGGSEKIQNRTSFGYSQENGEAKGNEMTSFTATSNTTVKLWDQVTVNMLLKGSIREVDGFAYGVDPFRYAYNTSRVIPAYNEDGSLYYHEKKGYSSKVYSGVQTYNYNILNEMSNTGSKNNTRTWGATIDVKWNILPGLEYQGLVAYNSSSADTKRYASERSFYITQTRGYEFGSVAANAPETTYTPLPMGGVLETGLTNTATITVRNSLVYDRLFKEKHRMTLQVGVETNSTRTKGESTLRYGYMPDRGESFAMPPASYMNNSGLWENDNSEMLWGSQSVVNRLQNELSEFAMAVYTYDERYVLNVNGRVDASNRFGQDKNKRFQPTWSVGGKWRVANEHFLNSPRWLNNLDLYGSYGYQGNAVTTVSPELIARNEFIGVYNGYGLKISSLPYPDLGWEKTKTFNLGMDASFLQGRVNFTFNYFKKISDVLSSRDIPYENGVGNGVVSGSTVENYGYDFMINMIPVRTKDFSWQLSLNTAVTRNSVEKNERINTLDDYLNGSCVVEGRPYSTFYSYAFDKLDPEYGQPLFKHMDDENAKYYKDILEESGKITPDFSGGLNTVLKYKRFSFYMLFAVQWGGHKRLPELYQANSTAYGLPLPEQNVSRKLAQRWKKTGDEANTIIPALPVINGDERWIMFPALTESGKYRENRYTMYNQSDVRVANTDFIRCRSLSLSYDFNEEWLKHIGVKYVQLKASMTNPFMWVSDKKWNGLDPETGDWPTRRVTSLSLHVMF